MFEESIRNIGLVVAALMAVSFVLAMLLFVFSVRRIKGLNIPEDAGFGEALLYTPLTLVLFVDLLDFALDILAAPFTWVILDRLGLKALKNVFAFEALLPFTQAIPTMTIAWFAARLLGPSAVQAPTVIKQ
ncbi:MAG: hypothetical protein ACK2U5_22510 [Candidatus Promineifilaceae bacterium]|jgi:hypothetical protein